jgi:hypothetical protein
MRPAHRAARPALLVSAVLLLSACGIPATGVVESGAPGTGIQSPTLIYFIRNGIPVAVPRENTKRAGAVTAVLTLFRGPTRREEAAGLTTAVPQLKFGPKVWTEGVKTSILLPGGTRPLSHAALEQLVCTAGHALHTENPNAESVQVVVTYPSGDSGLWQIDGSSEGCSLASPAAEAATPQPS